MGTSVPKKHLNIFGIILLFLEAGGHPRLSICSIWAFRNKHVLASEIGPQSSFYILNRRTAAIYSASGDTFMRKSSKR
jgi:hypothetical protein